MMALIKRAMDIYKTFSQLILVHLQNQAVQSVLAAQAVLAVPVARQLRKVAQALVVDHFKAAAYNLELELTITLL
jgi:hypothetical protein